VAEAEEVHAHEEEGEETETASFQEQISYVLELKLWDNLQLCGLFRHILNTESLDILLQHGLLRYSGSTELGVVVGSSLQCDRHYHNCSTLFLV